MTRLFNGPWAIHIYVDSTPKKRYQQPNGHKRLKIVHNYLPSHAPIYSCAIGSNYEELSCPMKNHDRESNPYSEHEFEEFWVQFHTSAYGKQRINVYGSRESIPYLKRISRVSRELLLMPMCTPHYYRHSLLYTTKADIWHFQSKRNGDRKRRIQ